MGSSFFRHLAWDIRVLLTLTLPRINDIMTTAAIKTIHAKEGALLTPGAKLLDLVIDLGATFTHDCPPISQYRIALRDRAWLRRLAVARGDDIAPGTTLALFSTEPSEPLDAPPSRPARVSVVGILDPSGGWDR